MGVVGRIGWMCHPRSRPYVQGLERDGESVPRLKPHGFILGRARFGWARILFEVGRAAQLSLG